MKNRIINFRNIRAKMISLCICVVFMTTAGAQPVLPTTADIAWYSSFVNGSGVPSPILGINTAVLCYGTGTPSGTADYMFASVYLDNSGNEVIWIDDLVGAVHTSAQLSTPPYSVPDVCIGNVNASSTDYIAAVAYVDGSNNVVVDFFDIAYSMSVLSTITLNSTVTVSAIHTAQTVHIDVIADYGNIQNNFAYCDRFVVTWDDFTSLSNPKVYIRFGDLNSYAVTGVNQQMNNSGGGIHAHTPDVAGIRRTISGTTYDMALVTYLDVSNNQLYYVECRSGLSPSGFRTLNNTSGTILAPRIDAMDDQSANALPSGDAVYKVVAQVDSTILGTVYSTIQTYDNTMSPGTPHFTCSDGLDISSLAPTYTVTPAYNHYAPTVGLAGPIDYRVQHYTNFGTTGQDIVFVEPINFSTPLAVIGEYWVNSQSGGMFSLPTTTDGYATFANSVSGPCNSMYDDVALYAWAFYNSTTTTYDVAYKLPAGLAYTFRPGISAVPAEVQAHKTQVCPNPAVNTLAVTYTGTDNAAGSYTIADMTGRELLQGGLGKDKTEVDVHMLAAGTYAIKIYRGGKADKDVLFVKN